MILKPFVKPVFTKFIEHDESFVSDIISKILSIDNSNYGDLSFVYLKDISENEEEEDSVLKAEFDINIIYKLFMQLYAVKNNKNIINSNYSCYVHNIQNNINHYLKTLSYGDKNLFIKLNAINREINENNYDNSKEFSIQNNQLTENYNLKRINFRKDIYKFIHSYNNKFYKTIMNNFKSISSHKHQNLKFKANNSNSSSEFNFTQNKPWNSNKPATINKNYSFNVVKKIFSKNKLQGLIREYASYANQINNINDFNIFNESSMYNNSKILNINGAGIYNRNYYSNMYSILNNRKSNNIFHSNQLFYESNTDNQRYINNLSYGANIASDIVFKNLITKNTSFNNRKNSTDKNILLLVKRNSKISSLFNFTENNIWNNKASIINGNLSININNKMLSEYQKLKEKFFFNIYKNLKTYESEISSVNYNLKFQSILNNSKINSLNLNKLTYLNLFQKETEVNNSFLTTLLRDNYVNHKNTLLLIKSSLKNSSSLFNFYENNVRLNKVSKINGNSSPNITNRIFGEEEKLKNSSTLLNFSENDVWNNKNLRSNKNFSINIVNKILHEEQELKKNFLFNIYKNLKNYEGEILSENYNIKSNSILNISKINSLDLNELTYFKLFQNETEVNNSLLTMSPNLKVNSILNSSEINRLNLNKLAYLNLAREILESNTYKTNYNNINNEINKSFIDYENTLYLIKNNFQHSSSLISFKQNNVENIKSLSINKNSSFNNINRMININRAKILKRNFKFYGDKISNATEIKILKRNSMFNMKKIMNINKGAILNRDYAANRYSLVNNIKISNQNRLSKLHYLKLSMHEDQHDYTYTNQISNNVNITNEVIFKSLIWKKSNVNDIKNLFTKDIEGNNSKHNNYIYDLYKNIESDKNIFNRYIFNLSNTRFIRNAFLNTQLLKEITKYTEGFAINNEKINVHKYKSNNFFYRNTKIQQDLGRELITENWNLKRSVLEKNIDKGYYNKDFYENINTIINKSFLNYKNFVLSIKQNTRSSSLINNIEKSILNNNKAITLNRKYLFNNVEKIFNRTRVLAVNIKSSASDINKTLIINKAQVSKRNFKIYTSKISSISESFKFNINKMFRINDDELLNNNYNFSIYSNLSNSENNHIHFNKLNYSELFENKSADNNIYTKQLLSNVNMANHIMLKNLISKRSPLKNLINKDIEGDKNTFNNKTFILNNAKDKIDSFTKYDTLNSQLFNEISKYSEDFAIGHNKVENKCNNYKKLMFSRKNYVRSTNIFNNLIDNVWSINKVQKINKNLFNNLWNFNKLLYSEFIYKVNDDNHIKVNKLKSGADLSSDVVFKSQTSKRFHFNNEKRLLNQAKILNTSSIININNSMCNKDINYTSHYKFYGNKINKTFWTQNHLLETINLSLIRQVCNESIDNTKILCGDFLKIKYSNTDNYVDYPIKSSLYNDKKNNLITGLNNNYIGHKEKRSYESKNEIYEVAYESNGEIHKTAYKNKVHTDHKRVHHTDDSREDKIIEDIEREQDTEYINKEKMKRFINETVEILIEDKLKKHNIEKIDEEKQIDSISNKVIEKIERKLKYEKRRRGLT